MKLLALLGLLFIGCSPTIQIVLPDADETQSVYVVPPAIDVTLPIDLHLHSLPTASGHGVEVWLMRDSTKGGTNALCDLIRVKVTPDSIRAVVPVDKSKKQKIIEASLELLKALLSPNK